MGGPSLSLTDTPSGSLSRTGMEFHPLGGAAITASNRDFAGSASPDFTCQYKLCTSLKHRLTTSQLFVLTKLSPIWSDRETGGVISHCR